MNYIDLFAGAGGLSEGFINTGFEPIAHVEMDKAACYTLKTRLAFHHLRRENKFDIYKSYLRGEITREELYSYIPVELKDTIINLPISAEFNQTIYKKITQHVAGREVDLIIGGPPCQAYSLVGRARSEDNMASDTRNYLYINYAKYLEKYNPKMFVFENVIGLKSAKGGQYLTNMKNLFFKKGYKMEVFTVEANNFGVLQKRKRIIIIGWKDDFIPNLSDLEAYRSDLSCPVENIFNDLPEMQAGEGIDKYVTYKTETNDYLTQASIRNDLNILTHHVSRPNTNQDKEIYKRVVTKWNMLKERLNYNELPESLKTHTNRTSFHDRFKIVAADENYSQTVVAHISKDGHYYIHPDINQNRSISVREAARLQSFSDDYYFEGVKEGANRTAAFKQIGNAVPPLMAHTIGQTIKDALK